MTKRALIVDDSKTAQLRLRKMLEKFDVEVDISNSAEEALAYLSYRQPAVIFLDHHMEGMSGLSALKIIKSNPSTALIPVVMYTSEQGDVYVGQARALGALDIISKEVSQYSSIEKVLSSLGVKPKSIGEPSEPKEGDDDSRRSILDRDLDAGHSAPAAFQSPGGSDLPLRSSALATDLIKVQSQVGKLFEIHMAKVRQEIEDSTKFIVRRLGKEASENTTTKVVGAKASKVEGESASAQGFVEPVVVEERKSTIWLPLLMLVAVGFVGYELLNTRALLKSSNEQSERLLAKSEEQAEVLQGLAAKLDADQALSSGADSRVMLDALGWAVNVNPQVPFGEKALGDERIYMLGELLALLKAANFTGTIFIDLHAGNFCAVKSPSGEWILPDPDTNTEECIFLANGDADLTLNDQISVGFLNYLHSTPVLLDGGISVELASMGYDSPKFSYPPLTSATSAGQWNAAAGLNSRLSFSFSPE